MAKENKLFKRFLGKNVNIIMSNIKGSQETSDGTIIQGNVIITGYLLDEDDEYYYLGKTDEEIDEALRKGDVIRIFLDNQPILEFDEDDFGGERH